MAKKTKAELKATLVNLVIEVKNDKVNFQEIKKMVRTQTSDLKRVTSAASKFEKAVTKGNDKILKLREQIKKAA